MLIKDANSGATIVEKLSRALNEACPAATVPARNAARFDPIAISSNEEAKIENSAEDFPALNEASIIDQRNYYRLPKTKPSNPSSEINQIRFSREQVNFPLAKFTGTLPTRRIFRDSEKFYGIDLPEIRRGKFIGANGSEAKNTRLSWEKKFAAQNPELSIQTRARRAISRTANQLFLENCQHPMTKESNRLARDFFKLNQEGTSFEKRETGFKDALKIYFDQIKTFQPYLYHFCLEAAKVLNSQASPSQNSPSAICSISAHQSETGLTRFLEQLNQQDFDKSKLPVFLFINGDNDELINARIDEINKFKQTHPDLDLRVISSVINDYRHGLKTIPFTTAMMSLALNDKLQDHDIATIFFDADIVRFGSPRVIQNHINAIQEGKIGSLGSYHDIELDNVNYEFLKLLDQASDEVKFISKILLDRETKLLDLINKGIHLSGGNSAASTIMLLLGCGPAAHTCNEDADLSQRTTTNIIRAYQDQISNQTKENPIDIVDANCKSKQVIYDGGAIIRAAETCRPIADIWDNHDEIPGNLSPIDPQKPQELNLRRVKQELEIFITKARQEFESDFKPTVDENRRYQISAFWILRFSLVKEHLDSFLTKYSLTINDILNMQV